MDAISLTTFVDFISRSGTPKMTVVREWKHGDEYEPYKDYWKTLREAIVAVHEKGEPIAKLEAVAASATDKKVGNYAALAKSYKKWVGKRSLRWFRPPKADWESSGVVVQVNPELGLEIDGMRHVVKLYFKGDKLPANRAALVLYMMHAACGPKVKAGTVMSLLDIRKGKLHTSAAPVKEHGVQLAGEAAYWATVFPNV